MRGPSVVLLGLLALRSDAAFGEETPAPPAASLAARLDDPDPVVRHAAAAALVELGDAGLGELASAEKAKSPLVRDLARSARRAIATAKRLRGEPQSEVPFWMDLEEALAIEPAAVRAATLLVALGDVHTIERVQSRLEAGRKTAKEFCRTWTDMGGAGTAESNRRQEVALLEAGPAAAPYLLAILAAEDRPSFRAQVRETRAGRDFVIAMDAVRILELRAAVPYLLRWVNGPSAWAHGVALQTLQALVGQDFGALLSLSLEDTEEHVLVWWRLHQGQFSRSTGWLVAAKLREIHGILAAVTVGAADPKGDVSPWDEGSYATWAAMRLRKIAGDDLALDLQGDVATQLATVRAAEAWAEGHYPR